MALYQTSVLKNYLHRLDKNIVNKSYKKYVKYFHNPGIQENIKKSKEEEYQGIFLTELFVNILGYTIKPNVNFNLVAEYKNQTNAQKADGAILKDDAAIAVIELKGTKTKDLESIRKQAFDYKANQKGCVYVVTSNYEKLRFYINDATEFEEFNLFTLTIQEFELLYLCLNKESIFDNIPLKIKEESITEEEKITKSFYADYSIFKRELFRDLVKKNAKFLKSRSSSEVLAEPGLTTEQTQFEIHQLEKNVKLSLFKKSQKLIDRFLFIFFAEDRDLLPPNSTVQILDKWKSDMEFGDERPLYSLFKQYFNYLDSGRKKVGKRAEIYAYNGGLFKPDPILDKLEIDSELLHKYTRKLANYDFESQVDVNILGHIFENSLNEIESVNAEIEGGDFDKQKSKRKKDGVFYTPKYITKYIVENTVGKLCNEKKQELGFKEEEYYKSRKGRQQTTLESLVKILDDYREWLLQLTICDPACGSGAFLNQALNFLINEHRYIDELKAKLLGGSLVLSDIENTILEKNIYGVDLNEESVEIAKLSLWLRTAQPRRKLNDLSSNIKCGNSLIDSKAVAGDKAFIWKEQFPHIFEKGGFDVIIGNPPYGVNITEGKNYFKKKYKSSEGPFELYKYFIEKSLQLFKKEGLLGFITPDTWVNLSYFKKLRNVIFSEYELMLCSETLYNVFEDAVVDTKIFVIKNNKLDTIAEKFNAVDESLMRTFNATIKTSNNDYLLNFKETNSIITRLDDLESNLDEYCEIWRGMSAYGAKSPDRPYNSITKETEHHKKLLNGGDIGKYLISWKGEYIKYGDWLHRPRPEYIYSNTKIMIQRIRNPKLKDRIVAVSDEDGFISSDGISNILLKEDYKHSIDLNLLLGVLNSKLINYWFSYYFFDVNIKPEQLRQIPLPNISFLAANGNSSLINKKLFDNKSLVKFSNKFIKYIQSQFQLGKLSKKLQDWHKLEFGDFIKELNKAIKLTNKENLKVADFEGVNALYIPTLTKKDEFEWLDLFEENKQKAQELQIQIKQTDKEIDAMVYELYGLSQEEIKIVENC